MYTRVMFSFGVVFAGRRAHMERFIFIKKKNTLIITVTLRKYDSSAPQSSTEHSEISTAGAKCFRSISIVHT